MGKAKSQVASLRAGHICQLPHLALLFSQQKDRWVASLVHQSGRLLAAAVTAAALGTGLPPDQLWVLLGNVQQLIRGAFLILGHTALGSACEVSIAGLTLPECLSHR